MNEAEIRRRQLLVSLAAFFFGRRARGTAPGTPRRVRVGEKFYVTLPLVAGTGSSWKWQSTSHFSVCTLTGREQRSLGVGSDTPGGLSGQVEQIVGMAEGRFVLRWDLLLHPWEREPRVVNRYSLIVVVGSR